MSWLGLEEEEKVRVLLKLPVVWVMALGSVDFLKMLFHLILLGNSKIPL